MESDLPAAQKVVDVEGVCNFIGKTSLIELAAMMTCSVLTITNDSVPLHLAIATGCPVVPIFGPSRSRALLPEKGKYFAVTPSSDCAPCYDNEPFPGCRDTKCIDSITVEMVWMAVREALKKWNQ